MRILFITDNEGSSGGIKQLFYNVQGLKPRGFEIFMAAKPGALIFDLAAPYLSGSLTVDFKQKLSDAKILAEYIQKQQIQILHTFHTKGHKLGVLTKRIYRQVKLYINRGVSFVPHNPFYVLHPGIDGFICNSQAVVKVLSGCLVSKKKLHLIYNAFLAEEFQFHSAGGGLELKSDLNICAVSSETKWKGLGFLLAALNRLPELKAHFYILGVKENEDLVGRLNPAVRDKVVFLGFRKDVPDILAQMDLFIFSPQAGDSCPNVVLEAFAAGLPVIGSDVGGIPELVKNDCNGFVVKKRNSRALAEKIAYLAQHPEIRDKMGRMNKSLVKQFSLERKIEHLMDVYRGELVREEINFSS